MHSSARVPGSLRRPLGGRVLHRGKLGKEAGRQARHPRRREAAHRRRRSSRVQSKRRQVPMSIRRRPTWSSSRVRARLPSRWATRPRRSRLFPRRCSRTRPSPRCANWRGRPPVSRSALPKVAMRSAIPSISAASMRAVIFLSTACVTPVTPRVKPSPSSRSRSTKARAAPSPDAVSPGEPSTSSARSQTKSIISAKCRPCSEPIRRCERRLTSIR